MIIGGLVIKPKFQGQGIIYDIWDPLKSICREILGQEHWFPSFFNEFGFCHIWYVLTKEFERTKRHTLHHFGAQRRAIPFLGMVCHGFGERLRN